MPKYKHPKVIETKLGQEQADGVMNYEHNTIYIDQRLRGQEKIEVWLHEYDHYLHPNKPEKQVLLDNKKLAEFLWLHHFRFVDNIK